MLVHDVEQGSPEWFAIRAGIPTASEFDKIITSTGKASTQAEAYMHRLIAEKVTGGTCSDFDGNGWTDRGNELEPEAVTAYEFVTDRPTEVIGFVTNDFITYGCSPDRLVGEEGLLEVKCPAAHTHIGYLLKQEVPTAYKVQVQGQMFVCDAAWCDFISYHPQLEPLIIRVERDPDFIQKLSDALEQFTEKMNEKYERLKEIGIVPVA